MITQGAKPFIRVAGTFYTMPKLSKSEQARLDTIVREGLLYGRTRAQMVEESGYGETAVWHSVQRIRAAWATAAADLDAVRNEQLAQLMLAQTKGQAADRLQVVVSASNAIAKRLGLDPPAAVRIDGGAAGDVQIVEFVYDGDDEEVDEV